MSNYERVRGVGYRRYVDDEDKPVTEQRDAVLEEMYFDPYSGEMDVNVTTDDGYLSVTIPVKHCKKWDKFATSLPVDD